MKLKDRILDFCDTALLWVLYGVATVAVVMGVVIFMHFCLICLQTVFDYHFPRACPKCNAPLVCPNCISNK